MRSATSRSLVVLASMTRSDSPVKAGGESGEPGCSMLAPVEICVRGELMGASGADSGVISSGRFRFWAIDWVTRLVSAGVGRARRAWVSWVPRPGGRAWHGEPARRAGRRVVDDGAGSRQRNVSTARQIRGSRFRRRRSGHGPARAEVPAAASLQRAGMPALERRLPVDRAN